jgi:microcin C transport system substrate-binding protein
MWSSASADRTGSQNWNGIKNPAIDAIIEDLIKAPTRDSLVAHTNALDRVLLWSHYVVPAYVVPEIWWAYWNKLGRPEYTPASGPQPAVWWFDDTKATSLTSLRNTKSGEISNSDGGGLRGILIFALAAIAGIITLIRFRRRRT